MVIYTLPLHLLICIHLFYYSCKLVKVAMKNNARSNSYQSLCEKSILVAANMIKLSSFSIAKMSLGIGGTPASPRNSTSSTAPNTVTNDHLHPGRSSRSLVPERSSKPITYLIEPNEGAGSSYVIQEEKGVDGKASDYIRKIHSLLSDSEETSIRPPPHVVK